VRALRGGARGDGVSAGWLRCACRAVAACLAVPVVAHAARAQDRAELRWGADPSGGAPFGFFDPNDPSRVIGFEVDITDELARRLGRSPVPERADWLALFDALEAKRCDILLNGFEVNDERAAVARFSVPYFRYGQQIVVRAADAGVSRRLPI
jgi:polar amino acid transport system substrate-binding protein